MERRWRGGKGNVWDGESGDGLKGGSIFWRWNQKNSFVMKDKEEAGKCYKEVGEASQICGGIGERLLLSKVGHGWLTSPFSHGPLRYGGTRQDEMQGQVLCGFVRCGGGQLFKGIRTVQGDQGMYEVDSRYRISQPYWHILALKIEHNIAFSRGGAHLPIAHALRLLSTQELRFGLTKLKLRKSHFFCF